MSAVSCIGLFSESIREEKRGTDSLVGIMSDNVSVPAFPGLIPQIAIYVRVAFEPKFNPGPMNISVVNVDNKPLAELNFDQSLVSQAISETALKKGPLVGLVGRIGIGNFEITKAGKVGVYATINGEKRVCAALNFELAPATN